MDILWPLFEEKLFDVEAPSRQFNPYRDRAAGLDLPDAPAIRRENLRTYLAAYRGTLPPLLLLAEAPGPWGCRFSGVPLVSEAKLEDEAFPISGRRSSTAEDGPYREYSAGIFWRVMRPFFPHFFVWNSVPFHPHPEGEPLGIRNPTRTEVRVWSDFLKDLLARLTPERTVAIGRKAERALKEAGADCTYVRHPSQGGARKFEAGIHAVVEEMNLPTRT